MTDQVIAEVILRAADGSSILDAAEGITAQTIEKYRVGADVIKAASRKLESLGFTIEQTSFAGVTISGSKELFETSFQTSLEVLRQPGMPSKTVASEQVFYRATQPVQMPADLSSLVAGIALPTPPEYFP